MLRIHCFSCQFACYRLLLEFPSTILKQYSVLNTAIFNLKHSSPDSTGKNFPVVFKMCSDTLFEIPGTTFLFPPCWDKIFGTALGMEEFRFQQTPSSRLWCGLIVSNCLLIPLHFPLSIQKMTSENNDSKYRLSNRPNPSSHVPLFQSESKGKSILMKMTLICMKMKLNAELIFSLRLVLKQRRKRTRKWPIA